MKTNFISNLKHFLFLLVAIFGTFSSPAQSTQTTIGGSKTPDPGGFMDIGGKKPPVGEVICLDFGDTGGGQPTTKPPILFFRNTVCGFASDDDTGGNGGSGIVIIKYSSSDDKIDWLHYHRKTIKFGNCCNYINISL